MMQAESAEKKHIAAGQRLNPQMSPVRPLVTHDRATELPQLVDWRNKVEGE